jgi:hypothetical protein
MKVKRFRENPIIRPNLDAHTGDNINGPSLIQVPAWVERRLSRYYLCSGHRVCSTRPQASTGSP